MKKQFCICIYLIFTLNDGHLWSFEIHSVKQYLVYVVLFGVKDL